LITFVPNDPLASTVPRERRQARRPDRASGRAGFSFGIAPPEGPHAVGTQEFLFWQCREAALAALDVVDAIDAPLRAWQGDRKTVPVHPNAGQLLNATYDRKSLSFFEWSAGGKSTCSGASTDAVVHEVGHAVLDALRPDLYQSLRPEIAAFHEAFGDILAILVGLFDEPTRKTLLAGPGLRKANFLESLAEDMADGALRTFTPQHPSAEARHALNKFVWQISIELPKSGSPKVLSREAHSFSRVFTGAVYDVLCNLYEESSGGSDRLLAAAKLCGTLLLAGAREAPIASAFFQQVGRTMMLADRAAHGGAHQEAIRDGFAAHGVALGSTVMLAPSAALDGGLPELSRRGRTRVPRTVRRDVLRRIRAPRGARLEVSSREIAGRPVVEAKHRREVPLGHLDRRLRGVVGIAVESVLLGRGPSRAHVLGALPDAASTESEVEQFVETLLETKQIRFGDEKKKRVKRAAARRDEPFSPTHAIRRRGGKKVLERIAFSCGSASESHVGRPR
jgi:hypothetical protein